MDNVLDLPDEMLLCIFKHLRLQDLMQCRLVCSRFLAICNSVKIEEFVFAHKIGDISDCWFHTNEPLNFKDAFDPTVLFYHGKNNGLKVHWESIRHRKIFSIFPRLQTLALISDGVEEDFEASINALRLLVTQKPSDVKIYFQSVELTGIAKINELKSPKSILAFQINNYHSLCTNVAFNGLLDYNEVWKLFNGNLPNDFFKKYFNCRAVKAADHVCQEHFVWFLKNFKYLNRLELEDTRLDQAFYDGLIELDQLTALVVKNSPISNHDFLLKMTLLEEFLTDEDNANFLDLACAMCSRLQHLFLCRFYVKRECVLIWKIERSQMFLFRRTGETENGSRDCTFERNLMELDELLCLVNEYKNVMALK